MPLKRHPRPPSRRHSTLASSRAAAEVSMYVGRAEHWQPGAGSGSGATQLGGAVIWVAPWRQYQPLYWWKLVGQCKSWPGSCEIGVSLPTHLAVLKHPAVKIWGFCQILQVNFHLLITKEGRVCLRSYSLSFIKSDTLRTGKEESAEMVNWLKHH